MGKFNKKRHPGLNSDQINKILNKVLPNEEKLSQVGNGNDNLQPIGRKQRRRNMKTERKMKRLLYSHSNAISTTIDTKVTPKNKKVRKQREMKKASGATKRKRKKEKQHKEQQENMVKENRVEVKQISDLEKLMHMKKKKKKSDKLPTAFVNDGLDYILNLIDGKDEDLDLSEEDKTSSDIDSDVHDEDFSDKNMDMEDLSDDEDKQSEQSDASGLDDKLLSMDDSASDIEHSSDEDVNCVISESKTIDDVQPNQESGNITHKYVPPAQRTAFLAGEKDKQLKIKRQLKGSLNRLSEANLHSICQDIENIFHSNSRAHVVECLTELILEQFHTADPIPERLITESAMLMAVMCCNIGTSVIAHFIEVTALKLNGLFKKENYGTGKEFNNLLQLLCSLFQLEAIQPKILLDLVEILCQTFSEKDMELLVLTLTAIGFKLRKENPTELKQVVDNITKAAQKTVVDGHLSRTNYLLEVLNAIKNNNARKLHGYDAEIWTNRNKKIKAMSKVDSEEFPNVSYQDLLLGESKGRWWIIGSAWTGTPMLHSKTENDPKDDTFKSASTQLVDMARKLRMNTDVRRRIFYAALSSEDFVDAFGNILKLKLKGKQLREVSFVLVECCQQQKKFNLFYFHLLKKLCQHDRQFVMSLQCCFWDRFKLLSRMSTQQTNNVTQLLAHLVVSEEVPLSCLKAIEFAKMDPTMVTFLRNLIKTVIAVSTDELTKPFVKIVSKKQNLVKQGLQLFIQHFMLKDTPFMDNNQNIKESLNMINDCLSKSR